jgi:predicted porin
MKKTLIVAAVSALAAGSALAQSSVTIYGRVNVTAERQDADGKKTYQLVNNASRIGFKGTEDLGGGLKANFILEHGFNLDTGASSQGASFWKRQSEANLAGGFGMVRLGNFTSEAYYATADYVSMHNHDTGPSSDALYAYVSRDTNKIAYRAPEFVKGLSLEGAVSAGEGAAKTTRSYDFAANYALGGLQLGAGAARNNAQEQFAVRALYEFGSVILGGYVQRDKEGYNPLGAQGNKSFGNRTTYRLTGAYMLGSSEFHLNFGSAGDYSKVNSSSAKQFTVGYNYNLSKRTKVYGYYTKVDDSTAKVYGGDFSSIAVGLRHNF